MRHKMILVISFNLMIVLLSCSAAIAATELIAGSAVAAGRPEASVSLTRTSQAPSFRGHDPGQFARRRSMASQSHTRG